MNNLITKKMKKVRIEPVALDTGSDTCNGTGKKNFQKRLILGNYASKFGSDGF